MARCRSVDRRRGALAALALLLLVAGPAGAQMGGGGGGMGGGGMGGMDVRTMSGKPLPDRKVAAGSIGVLVLRGDFGAAAPAGTPVHLVMAGAGGELALQTKATSAEGRVEFSGLPTDGSRIYQVLASLGEDRLRSDIVELPQEAGVRLMLVGRKVDAQGNPEGPSIDDASGGVEVPAGEVRVRVTGPGLEQVELVEVGATATVVGAARVETRDGGSVATFRGVAPGAERVYAVRAKRGERPVHSQAFQLTAAAGVQTQVSVAVNDRLRLAVHAGGTLQDERMWFEASFALVNSTGAPVDPGPEGLLIPLPRGFQNASVSDEAMARRVAVDQDRGLVWRGPVPTGQHDIVVQWAHGVEHGTLEFDLPAPLGFVSAQLVWEQVPGATVTPPAGVTPQPRSLPDGRALMTLTSNEVPAGGALRFRIEGLPQRPASERIAGIVVGLIVLGMVLFALWAAVKPRAGAGGHAEKEGRRRVLAAERDRLYDEVVELERRREARGGDVASIAAEREALVARLTDVLRALDRIDFEEAAEASTRPVAEGR